MSNINLEDSVKIIDATLAKARELALNPMTAVVLDTGGQIVALKKEDNSALMRADIAIGKAYAALGMGISTAVLEERAKDRPWFIDSLASVAQGKFVPVAGAHLIRDESGNVVGALGVTGAPSVKDVECARAGIAAAGFQTDPD